MSRRAVIGWLGGILVALASGVASAQPLLSQTPGSSTLPTVPTVPPVTGTPGGTDTPPVPPKLPNTPKLPPVDRFPLPPTPGQQQGPPNNSTPLPTPTPTPTPGSTPSGFPPDPSPYDPIPGPAAPMEIPGKPWGRPAPIPGSVEDDYIKELTARDLFRTYTWNDTAITAFPSGLLWEPGMAVQRDPRMKAIYSNQSNFRGANSLDTSIGGTQGLYRLEFAGQDLKLQTDIFGLVQTRLSPEDVTYADYRFGFPVTVNWGWWQAKIAYEHTSSHLGDRLIRAVPQEIPSWSKDEFVLGVGRILYDQLRIYANYGYAWQLIVPGVQPTFNTRSRYDFGFEWYDRRPTGFWGTPFIAGDIEWQGSQGNVPNLTIQAGWLWRNPGVRLAQYRVFVEHYRGQSPYGINSTTREDYTAVGLAFDY